ncbi:hypothetical protein SBRCBS47491_006896 [Sporothrix bragantina]|uniref:Cyclohexanone monooxygenase n=1 Tax=Sporothrix bragantina TaxID=671064 RepID=A0ABP0C8Q7_9PEZI
MASIDGNNVTNTASNTNVNNDHMPASAYTVKEAPLGTARHVRIVGIGAGASGINMVRTLRLQLRDNFEHVVYEKNSGVGGTWHENRYPGCRCDIPSHNYQFSWRPNHTWSNFFSPAEEINAYLGRICDDENMRDSVIKTEHEVLGAHWDEAQGCWLLSVANLRTGEQFSDYANFLIDASGILNNWKWPDLPGLHGFKGDLVHSARWSSDFDYKDKTVAVIGNGSSGVQIVPAIYPQVKKLVHVVRTPTWILPPRVQIFAMGPAAEMINNIELDDDENFTPEQVARFQSDPAFYRSFVKTIEKETNSNFPIMIKNSQEQAIASGQVRQYMSAMLDADERLCKALIPDYALGCRRMTPAPMYLQTLTQPNVQVVAEGIRCILPHGLELASGEVVEVDAIVCATGFDVSFCPRFPLVGRNGNLQHLWRDKLPQAYMSCAVPGLPNYFTFLGPNAPIGHGSVFTLAEHIATYIAGIIRKCQTEGIKAIVPSQAAVDDYSEHISTFMPRTAWASSCSSWYKSSGNGIVTALHPGSRIHFFHMLETFRGEDFEYVYEADGSGAVSRRNRFHYLGNGFSTKELDPDGDPTWYLDNAALAASTADSRKATTRIKAQL